MYSNSSNYRECELRLRGVRQKRQPCPIWYELTQQGRSSRQLHEADRETGPLLPNRSSCAVAVCRRSTPRCHLEGGWTRCRHHQLHPTVLPHLTINIRSSSNVTRQLTADTRLCECKQLFHERIASRLCVCRKYIIPTPCPATWLEWCHSPEIGLCTSLQAVGYFDRVYNKFLFLNMYRIPPFDDTLMMHSELKGLKHFPLMQLQRPQLVSYIPLIQYIGGLVSKTDLAIHRCDVVHRFVPLSSWHNRS